MLHILALVLRYFATFVSRECLEDDMLCRSRSSEARVMNHHITHSLTMLDTFCHLFGVRVLLLHVVGIQFKHINRWFFPMMTNIDDESDAAWESFPTCIS